MSMNDRDREHRVQRRTGRRIVVGAIVGAVAGAIVGLIAGALIFEPGNVAFWTMGLGGAILGGGIAFVQGGFAGLESVNPGNEPFEHDEPLEDGGGSWTSTERDDRPT